MYEQNMQTRAKQETQSPLDTLYGNNGHYLWQHAADLKRSKGPPRVTPLTASQLRGVPSEMPDRTLALPTSKLYRVERLDVHHLGGQSHGDPQTLQAV